MSTTDTSTKTVLAADLFCGAGGASTGFSRACTRLGLKTSLLAINHWPTAVATPLPVVNGRALDIRLRMLKPHELARAHSFGDDYQFTGNQGDKVKQIGNSWPTKLGEALITTLIRGYADKQRQLAFKAIA